MTVAVEPPREVFLAACEAISERIGYRFSKSARTATLDEGRTRFRVYFQSDRNNMAGEHVRMIIHAHAENRDYLSWQKKTDWPLRPSGVLLGGQIGNLQARADWMSWQLVDPARRPDAIDDAVAAIRALAFPLFERCADLTALAETARRERLPGLHPDAAVGLCVWRLGTEAAEQAMALWISEYPARLESFRQARDQLLAGGAPSPYASISDHYARIAVALGIGLTL